MRKIWCAAGLAAIALTVSACASSSSSTATSGSTPAAGSSTVSATSINGTQVLVNSQGMTLYWFVPDTSTASKCSGSCATFWPPLKGPVAAGAGVSGQLSTITRSDGSTQATYDGHPLYTYAADTASGQAKGNGLNASGGVWWMMEVSGATPAAKASTGGGGYGY